MSYEVKHKSLSLDEDDDTADVDMQPLDTQRTSHDRGEIRNLNPNRRVYLSNSSGSLKIPLTLRQVSLSQLCMATLSDPECHCIPIPSVEDDVLQTVCAYLHYHNGQADQLRTEPLRSNKMADIVSCKWDAKFADDNFDPSNADGRGFPWACKLLMAALSMGISPLIQLMSAKIACVFRGLSYEEMMVITQLNSSYHQHHS